MEALLLLASPIVVSGLVQGIKKLKGFTLTTHKASALRLLAGTLSFAGVVLTAWVTDGEVPVAEVETYVSSVLVFAATQIPYWLGKKSV